MQLVDIGHLLKQARHAAGLTQVQLSEITGVDASHISRVEHGKRGATFETWDKLMRACGAHWAMDVTTAKQCPDGDDRALFTRAFQAMAPEERVVLTAYLELHDPETPTNSRAGLRARRILSRTTKH